MKDRTAQLPDGRVVMLASIFGSGHDVRAVLARLLASENKCSDQRLSEMLRAEGFPWPGARWPNTASRWWRC